MTIAVVADELNFQLHPYLYCLQLATKAVTKQYAEIECDSQHNLKYDPRSFWQYFFGSMNICIYGCVMITCSIT